MPTYVFKCQRGHTIELKLTIQELEDDTVPHFCWTCYFEDDEKISHIRRVIQPAAVHFKGGGWGGSKT